MAPKHNSNYMKMDTLKKNKTSEVNRRVSVRIEPLELQNVGEQQVESSKVIDEELNDGISTDSEEFRE